MKKRTQNINNNKKKEKTFLCENVQRTNKKRK